ncbi:ribonuclease J [Salipaludibacillus agaradhaerens]|uniref:ribonuclease J n=1 Tax=Salipaludibacillus agaradhaerens TaxID=76935 RepID=UPI002151D155|nr:ribonuclease J [Salipaludibacillus agaradhaerens]MCR6107011.1 ribonuclease J [Salipaludibacillus agaradhaerens]MCR6119042.1 ribonuclease J [Salipaludibacillus agaradhaerens]UJW58096.1 ribonuclease J [Bacillus sp. A116_S68]
MSNQQTEKIRIFSLGGLDEIGKNMYVLEMDDDIIIIDAGCMHPEDDMLGVDIVIPDITYLVENKDRVKGIIVTHGHDDHIGAIPYVLRDLNVPVYGSKFTLALVKDKCSEIKVKKKPKLIEIHADSKIKIGKTPVNFFHTNHSIPDSLGVILHTSQGPIVYTGDFKFDQNPVDGQTSEIGKLTELGEKGVLCLLSDSQNAEIPGNSLSESIVAEGLKDAFHEADGRIIVSLYASHIHRIQQVLTAAENEGRKVVVTGTDIEKVIKIALDIGYLSSNNETLIEKGDIKKYARDELVILTTGSQGEPVSCLARMAKGSHNLVKIEADDRIIISAMPNPGNEKAVSQMVDLLSRTGANVIYGKNKKIHVSGHANQEELKMMLNLVKPQHFIPISGEFRMQYAHRHLARSVGMDDSRIFLLEKGELVEFTKRKGKRGNKIPSGHVLIDGLGVGDVGNIVLRDRRLLSKDGILVVVVTLNKKHSAILSGPDIISRGFVYVRESEALINQAEKLVTETLQHAMEQNQTEWSQLKTQVRDQLSRFLYEKTKRRPMIMPIIMEA